MSTAATRLRDAIVERLRTLPGYLPEIRKTPVPQLQPSAEAAALSVYITGEELTPDGDGNAGTISFVSEITIGISDVRGFAETSVLEGQQDAAVDQIEAVLLTDPDFTRLGSDLLHLPYFEAVSRIRRRRLFPQIGETYFAELRLEMTFVVRVEYEPVIRDDLKRIRMIARPLPADDETPGIEVELLDQA